ncbi:hypothetical protein QWY28_09990 [Nocardioides sp. SOB77]|uniref:Uncharacterized protein n=1 Tax=Nocardioides oceani TaxID=3058369 RepID=A0ABT8FF23_9ACTN|nr:hypothetical protein [Nocardioides oceani]MDN4173272.1 hypothetical protein [Nocardioides oceani]
MPLQKDPRHRQPRPAVVAALVLTAVREPRHHHAATVLEETAGAVAGHG